MKSLKIVYTIGLIGILSSCADFLTEDPKSQIAVSQYFTSPEDAYSVVNGLYRLGVPSFYIGSFAGSNMMMGGYMSGYFDNERRGERPGPQEAINLSLNGENLSEYLGSWWFDCYNAISRSNTAIKYIPTIPGLANEEMNDLLAEARFFRALNYFYLVKNFGDVPLIEEPYESLENIFSERTSSEEVYNLIVADLNWGIKNSTLPYTPFHSNGFRITKAAIAGLLADVYLQMSGYPLEKTENYAHAAQTAKLIIESGGFQLIEHGASLENSAYNKMRTSDTESEYIYSIEYNADLAPNTNPQYSYPGNNRPASVKYGNTYVAYKPSEDYINMYMPFDLRVQNKQYFYNEIEVGDQVFAFNFHAPYIWHDDVALFESGRGDKDIKALTYAEVLLIAAEAIAQSGGITDEAVTYLAMVRSRAYPDSSLDEVKANLVSLSKNEFIEEVYKERLRELPFSFKIWSDIQRTRLYPTVTGKGQIRFENFAGQENGWGRTFQEYHLLFPIPEKEMQRNPNLTQNAGY